MPYKPNTTRWQKGDHVIHSHDAKKAQMLMVVDGYDPRTGECITHYIHPMAYEGRVNVWKNDIKWLHDPKEFDIEIPEAPTK